MRDGIARQHIAELQADTATDLIAIRTALGSLITKIKHCEQKQDRARIDMRKLENRVAQLEKAQEAKQ